ncbi:MAG: RnfABCDGE type electron transport complex subunit D [Planctomycetaceae bacterium]|nr:RnfABCDGE type electron transport complex subunit D [Planctomycetaceae bacterium]
MKTPWSSMLNPLSILRPALRTAEAPHVRDPASVARQMWLTTMALLPCLLARMYGEGWRMVAIVAVSYATMAALEAGNALLRRRAIDESILVAGSLLALLLPYSTPLWMVALGAAVAVLQGKILLNDVGRNRLNGPLVAWVLLALLWPDVIQAKDSRPDELLLLLAALLGGGFLLAAGVTNWRMAATCLFWAMVLSGLLHWQRGGSTPLWHELGGGLLLGTLFIASDRLTSPITAGGKWICGTIVGISVVLLRETLTFSEGAMLALLLGNLLAPLLDSAVFVWRLKRLPAG